eukprot:gene31281-62569_t
MVLRTGARIGTAGPSGTNRRSGTGAAGPAAGRRRFRLA